jgi:hypothetical protein
MFGLSSPRVQDLWKSWSALSLACRTLGEQAQFTSLFPHFMPHLVELTRDFAQFNKFAIVIFNSLHPNNDGRAHTKTAIWPAGEAVLRDWFGFIEQLNAITGRGLRPFFPVIAAALDHTIERVLELAGLYFVGCITSNVSPDTLTQIRREFMDWRLRAASREADFDARRFLLFVERVGEEITDVFLDVAPKFTYASGELIQDKLQVKIALKELSDLARGIVRFQDAAVAVRDLVFQFNKDLMDAMQALGLPWNVALSCPNDKLIMFEGAVLEEKPAEPRVAGKAGSPRRAVQ